MNKKILHSDKEPTSPCTENQRLISMLFIVLTQVMRLLRGYYLCSPRYSPLPLVCVYRASSL